MLLFLAMPCDPVSAETIKLRSGTIVQGKIIELTDDHVVIDKGKNSLYRLNFDQIDNETLATLKTLPQIIRQKETPASIQKESQPPQDQPRPTGSNYDQHFDKAKELFGAGDVDGAVSYFEKAIQDSPDIIDPYLNIGLCYLKTNQFPKAIEAFNRVKKIFPNDWQAYYRLAYLYGEPGNGEMAKALENYGRAKELGIKDDGDELGNLLAPFQPKDFSVEYEPLLNNPGKKKVTINIRGNPAVDKTGILDTIQGLEQVESKKKRDFFIDIEVKLIRLEQNQTIAKEKWVVKGPQGQNEYWVKYDFAPPPDFHSKIKIEISESVEVKDQIDRGSVTK